MKQITVEEYAEAIVRLLSVAQRDTGQSRRAAQVLLSAYNGEDFQLSIPDLGGLDLDLYEAAIVVIRGRIEVSIEPHKLVKDGSMVFERLWDRWVNSLHVENRGKFECRRCAGWGRAWNKATEEYNGDTCELCEGTGRVCRCKQ